MLGLLSDPPLNNCWTIAEWAGDRTPDGMQHLLGRAKCDADQVRDDVGDYVVEHPHADEAVLVVDETDDVKKGTDTVGVQHQYTGTAGRVENSQVADYLAYSPPRGSAVAALWSGKPVTVRLEDLDKICAALDCTVADLMQAEPESYLASREHNERRVAGAGPITAPRSVPSRATAAACAGFRPTEWQTACIGVRWSSGSAPSCRFLAGAPGHLKQAHRPSVTIREPVPADTRPAVLDASAQGADDGPRTSNRGPLLQ